MFVSEGGDVRLCFGSLPLILRVPRSANSGQRAGLERGFCYLSSAGDADLMRDRSLELQERSFDGQAPAVTGQAPVPAYDPMAGNHDGDRVGSVGRAYCPGGRWPADSFCQFAIRDHMAVRDSFQFLPYLDLKGCPGRGERQVESGESFPEVGIQLIHGFTKGCAHLILPIRMRA